MSFREDLIQLIQEAAKECPRHQAEGIADHLIANNVGFLKAPKKAPTSLVGKCGGCKYAIPMEHSEAWVKCSIKKKSNKTVYQRTLKACRHYEPKEEIIEL